MLQALVDAFTEMREGDVLQIVTELVHAWAEATKEYGTY